MSTEEKVLDGIESVSVGEMDAIRLIVLGERKGHSVSGDSESLRMAIRLTSISTQ